MNHNYCHPETSQFLRGYIRYNYNKQTVINVLICREAAVTYNKDVALKGAWHEEVGTMGLNHTIVSRLAQWYLRWLR